MLLRIVLNTLHRVRGILVSHAHRVFKANTMASSTPTKSVSDKILNLCRCCNNENARRVSLYGCKSKNECLVEAIVRFTQLDISEDDDFSKWICRSCLTKIQTLKKNVDEFKALCEETVQKQKKELANARTKRGRKNGDSATQSEAESPIASQVNTSMPKRSRISESRASRSLCGMFQAIAPKPSSTPHSSSNPSSLQLSEAQSLSSTRLRRPLPASFPGTHTTASGLQPEDSEEVSLLSTCGLQALKVIN